MGRASSSRLVTAVLLVAIAAPVAAQTESPAVTKAAQVITPAEVKRHIYVIADDVLVTRDVFAFHEAAHAIDPDAWFVSSATGESPYGDRTAVYRGEFRDLRCVSFPTFRIAKLAEHAVSKYYRDMIGYCAERLDVGLPVRDAELPGLIRRVMRDTSWSTYGLFPTVPRAYHVGFVGTNRGGQRAIEQLNPTDWRDDADQIMAMTSDQLNERALSEYRDLVRGPLITEPVPLRVV
jgi:hypothetical protein